MQSSSGECAFPALFDKPVEKLKPLGKDVSFAAAPKKIVTVRVMLE